MIASQVAQNSFRRTVVMAVVAVVVSLAALTVAAGDARATTVKVTKPATLVFMHGNRADAPGNCGAVIFVQWTHVAGVSSALAVYHSADGTKDSEGASGPDFHNSVTHVIPFTAPAGTDWISVGFGSIAGFAPDTCADMSAKQKTLFDLSPAKTWVELSVDAKPPVIASTKGAVKLGKTRLAKIGTVTCPADGSCTVAAKATTTVKIAGTKYTVAVVVPKKIAAGATVPVSVRFPKAAAMALKGTNVRAKVQITAANLVEATATALVARKITG